MVLLKQKQFQYDSSINQINNANKEQLNPFIERYLSDHSYFKPRDIAIDYLNKEHQITFYDLATELDFVINPLIHKITKLIAPYKLSGTIEKYNAKTYQVINRKQSPIDRIL